MAQEQGHAVEVTVVQSPPAAPQPAREAAVDPRATLRSLAEELRRASNRRALVEYLQLRRAVG